MTAPVRILPNVARENLVLEYTFFRGSGDTVVDSSGNANHGKLYNSPTWNTKKVGYALTLDGSTQYIEANNVITAKPFSVVLLVKLNTISKSNLLDSRDTAFAGGGKGSAIEDNDGDGKYKLGIGDGTNYLWTKNILDLTDFAWHVIVVPVSTAKLKVYLDKTLVGALDISSIENSPLNVASVLKIGYGLVGHVNADYGYFAVINNYALTDSEIQTITDILLNLV